MAVAIYSPRFRLLALNRRTEELWDQAAQAEFGSREAVERAFVESCKIERDKPRWYARIIGPQGATVVVAVHASSSTWKDEPCLSYVLVPDTAAGPAGAGVYAYGQLRVDEPCVTVMYGRSYVPVTATEFKLTAALCAKPWTLYRKSELLRDVWGVRGGQTRTLDVTVSRLRSKLTAHGCQPSVIRTLHGQGYLFDPTPLMD